MFKRVLLCYDGSETGRKALKRGAELALLVNARVHVLSVISQAESSSIAVANSLGPSLVIPEDEHRRSVGECVEKLKERGVEAQGYVGRGDIIDVIAAYSRDLEVDLIVVGNYPKSSGGRWWSGPGRASLAERVSCCVFIATRE
jgi:nucleotide-binding universal stress UspA family protein